MSGASEADEAVEEQCLRRLISRRPYAQILWKGDNREALRQAMSEMYGADVGKAMSRRVDEQIVASVFQRIALEFQQLIDDKKRLSVKNVLTAVRDLDEQELDEQASYVLLCALVHTALHYLLSNHDIEDAWTSAKKMIQRGERINESERIYCLREKSIVLVKVCAQRGLSKGAKEMAMKASEFEKEVPVKSVIEQLVGYAEDTLEGLGGTFETSQDTLGVPVRPRTGTEETWGAPSQGGEETEEEVRVGEAKRGRDGKDGEVEVARRKRTRHAGREVMEMEATRRVKRRAGGERSDEEAGDGSVGRRRGGLSSRGRRKIEAPEDSDGEDIVEEVPKKARSRQSRRRREEGFEWQTPKGDENDEDKETEHSLTDSQKRTLSKLGEATEKLSKAVGKDPLEEAERNARTARRSPRELRRSPRELRRSPRELRRSPRELQQSPRELRRYTRAARKKDLYLVSPNGEQATPIVESSDEEVTTPRPSRSVPFAGDPDEKMKTPRSHRKGKDISSEVSRRGQFSMEEDELLVNGLKKFGWSEWQRIADNCWGGRSFRRTAMQVKDRARYLEKAGRIARTDYPVEYPYKRAGPLPAVSPSISRTLKAERISKVRRTPSRKSARLAGKNELNDEDARESLDEFSDDTDKNENEVEAEAEAENVSKGRRTTRSTRSSKIVVNVEEDMDQDEDEAN